MGQGHAQQHEVRTAVAELPHEGLRLAILTARQALVRLCATLRQRGQGRFPKKTSGEAARQAPFCPTTRQLRSRLDQASRRRAVGSPQLSSTMGGHSAAVHLVHCCSILTFVSTRFTCWKHPTGDLLGSPCLEARRYSNHPRFRRFHDKTTPPTTTTMPRNCSYLFILSFLILDGHSQAHHPSHAKTPTFNCCTWQTRSVRSLPWSGWPPTGRS